MDNSNLPKTKMTTACCMCESISEECPADFKTIDQSRIKLIKSILKLAGIQFKYNKSALADICAQCNKDLVNFEKFLGRIVNSKNWESKLPTQTSLPVDVDSEAYIDSIDETNMTDTFEQTHFDESKRRENEITHDILPGKRLRRPIDSIDETNMNDTYNSKKRSTETSHDILPGKRLRRPPRRFRDDETFSAKDQKMQQRPKDISRNRKHLQNSQFHALPKMAEIRISDDLPPIGDIVEVQSSGKFSRLRILCRACTEAFSQENNFREHFSVNHQNKDYQGAFNEMNLKFLYFCILCKKQFSDHFSVRRHFKATHTHTELRVFSCDLCPAAFKYKTSLEKHKAKHLNLKKHECPECFKKFIDRFDLLIHNRIHTGEKPFKCQTCPSKFSDSSNLKRHQQTHRKNSKSINFLESEQNTNIPEQISKNDDYTEDNREKSYQIKINSTTEESKEITEEISTKLNFQQEPYNSSINTVMINASKTNANANIVDNLNSFSNLCSAEERSTERESQINITPKKSKIVKIPQILQGKKLQFNQLKSILKNNAYPSAAKKEPIRLSDCSVESQLNKTIKGNNSITDLSVVCATNSKSNHGIKTQTIEEFKPKNQLKFLTPKSTDNKANNIIHINSTNAEEIKIMECNEYTNEKLPAESPLSSELQSQAKDADKLLKGSEVNQFYDFPKTCMPKSPLKFKILPNSLLKPQEMLQPSNKPIITDVQILPQLNLKFMQSNPLSENDSSPAPSVFKLPVDYKFQCPSCGKYFKQKSALTKHLRTHSGEKPYKCQICPKSYADASNYKKHKLLHTKAADALNKLRQKPPLSPALSSVTDPDPDGIEVLHTVKPFELTTSEDDDDDDLETYHLWKEALEQQPFINKDIQENIRRNLKAIMPPMPADESSYRMQRSSKLFSPKRLQCKSLD